MWPARLEQWREDIEAAATATGLDPTLIAAVMDRESLGGVGLTPKGPHGTGDFDPNHPGMLGHGRGLMQIDDRAFPVFCADPGQWQDAGRNIMFGAQLLARNLIDLDGNTAAAVAAYNCGVNRIARLLAAKPDATSKDFDGFTTGGNYSLDVLERKAKLDEADREDPPPHLASV